MLTTNRNTFSCKADGPNHHIIGRVDQELIDTALNEIGGVETWPQVKRDKHHILNQGRSLIFRDEKHCDTDLRGSCPSIERIVNQVLELGFGSVPAKIVCAYLPPGKVIKPHKDGGQYYTFHNRIHVPLVTNPGVIMTVDGEEYQMHVGNIYLFQNLRRHAARNQGPDPRIHLIMDLLDPRYSEETYHRLWWPLMLNAFGIASGYRWLRSRNAPQARLLG
jgi:hypothetical protein